MALDATVGGTSANSYVTLAEAEAYFVNRPFASAWASFSEKEQVLVLASSMLDWYVSWKGNKTDDSQSMQWPRTSVLRPDGTEIDDSTIPSDVKTAVYELALFSLDGDRMSDDPLAGIGQAKVSSLMIKAGPEKPNQTNKKALPSHIWKILSDLYLTGEGITVIRLMRA